MQSQSPELEILRLAVIVLDFILKQYSLLKEIQQSIAQRFNIVNSLCRFLQMQGQRREEVGGPLEVAVIIRFL